MARNEADFHYRRPKADAARERRALLTGFGIAAIVTFAIVCGVLSVLHSNSTHENAVDSAQAAEPHAAAQATQSQQNVPEAKAPASADSSSLAWRDADFAVNPDRTDWNMKTNGKKTVYLTIDDGPSEKTQQVLDILDRYGCKATFFVVGHNEDYFPMIAEAYRRGHTIGMHTYTHDYAQVYSSPDAFFADLDAIGEVVKGQIGYVPCFIRFPGGSSNEISEQYCAGIMSELVGDVQARGYQYYDWNLSVGDGSEHTTEEIIGYGTEPVDDENIMLLCHDSATKQSTVDALPAIIEHYQSLGYTFEAIDRSSWVCHHGVNN
ncbi:MAG: polysaccharide deacetylase [Eggerthellaceae bacterium]|nr:polysaccharide deacetylase [Eggerthellaceae bacterium]